MKKSMKIALSVAILIAATLAVLHIHATAVVIPSERIVEYSAANAAIAYQYSVIVWSAALSVTALWIHPAAKWLADNKEKEL